MSWKRLYQALIAMMALASITLLPLGAASEAVLPPAATADAQGEDTLLNLTDAYNAFGFELYLKILPKHPHKNVFISPTSVSLALAMTLGGAGGTTEEAMVQVMHLDDMSRDVIARSNRRLIGRLDSAGTGKGAFPDRDTSAETQRRFDAVARTCREAGYSVLRMPVVPAADGRTYWTYLNVVIDRRGAERIVYMPVYRGAEALNREAAGRWRAAGFRVRPVDCTATFRHGGSLRCLVNVLARKPA